MSLMELTHHNLIQLSTHNVNKKLALVALLVTGAFLVAMMYNTY